MTTAFSSLGLNADLLANLATLDYHNMTPIQAGSLPLILAGRDVIGQGKTGSGKTAAFGLGLLQKLDVKRFAAQALVLCPTRELADQVAKEIRRLGRGIHNIKVLTLCGGMPMGPQIGSLEHGAHIIVGTPGRIEEHLVKGTLQFDALTTLVLDEADRMLDMGFQPSLDAILEYLPSERQTLLFSATFPSGIEAIAQRVMQAPERVQMESTHDSSSIAQVFYPVQDSERTSAVRLLLLQQRPDSAVVFCNTKIECAEVARDLARHGFSALALHGDLEQRDRHRILVQFANKSISVLVATDVAARGLDIDALDMVINYHIPRDLEVYVHRIGRTGRAGSSGFAGTLFSDKESHKLAKLEALLDQSIDPVPLPPHTLLKTPGYKPPMVSLEIGAGKKQKLRPGDILGALTSENGLDGKQVGKITLYDNWSCVAVRRSEVDTALDKLGRGKVKGRSFRVRVLE
ncbi:ATP-dependent RNA helicase DbpA [Parahaliea aestuarii]|uniref:ATP-dependent RNA helicase DbpA n=1 Tax=Parahaliea aestuarii TaxID=1852021 RepID=A0A5C9A5S4_9GAMM|nr:ATP-dependent RNA helicase DbpA [Parahaliea aestuarii]TXS95110.1 ATP-dependent RNA helicase DbpA [Parahaliea aestuarii]